MLPSPRKFGKLKKPSKADILRNAIIYIENLQCLVNGGKPSIKEIKHIHEQTTPQKGESIALPALELACDDQRSYFQKGGATCGQPGVIKRVLYNESCRYSDKTVPQIEIDQYTSDNNNQRWCTTPSYINAPRNRDTTKLSLSEEYDFASELGCSMISFPCSSESAHIENYDSILWHLWC